MPIPFTTINIATNFEVHETFITENNVEIKEN